MLIWSFLSFEESGISYENGLHIAGAEDTFSSAVIYIVPIIHVNYLWRKEYYSDHWIWFLYFFHLEFKVLPELLTIPQNIGTGVCIYYPDIQFALKSYKKSKIKWQISTQTLNNIRQKSKWVIKCCISFPLIVSILGYEMKNFSFNLPINRKKKWDLCRVELNWISMKNEAENYTSCYFWGTTKLITSFIQKDRNNSLQTHQLPILPGTDLKWGLDHY